MARDLSVILPAFDSGASLAVRLPVLRKTLAALFDPLEFLVVDDGSGADLESLLGLVPDLRVLRCRSNLGKGATSLVGLLASHHQHVLVTDADVPFDMESYERIGHALVAGAPAVIGCRRRAESQVLLRFDALRYVAQRHVIGIALNRLVRALTGLPYTDTQCGIKGFDRTTALALFERVFESGFLFDIELLLAAGERGTPVQEVPVCVIYEDSSSTLRFVSDASRTAQGLARIWSRKRAGAYGGPGGIAGALGGRIEGDWEEVGARRSPSAPG